MPDADEQVAVRARAVLVDASTGDVLWSNHAADDDSDASLQLEDVLPLTRPGEALSMVRDVAESGVARHLSTDLVSTVRGSIAVVTSLHRLPNGLVLILSENSWQQDSTPRRRADGRRRRR